MQIFEPNGSEGYEATYETKAKYEYELKSPPKSI